MHNLVEQWMLLTKSRYYQRLQFLLVNQLKLADKVVEMFVTRVNVRFLHNQQNITHSKI